MSNASDEGNADLQRICWHFREQRHEVFRNLCRRAGWRSAVRRMRRRPRFPLPASATAQAQASSADTASSEKVLYRFGGGKDGENPESSLVDVSGTLYGVTNTAAAADALRSNSPPGCGTIFRINASGSGYRVLHRYRRSARAGFQPVGSVIYRRGTLYGTTSLGDGSV